MSIRYHKKHVWFDPEFTFPPKMAQAEAAALIKRGDEASRKKVIEGHMWLARDITSRFLHKLNVDKLRGENVAWDLLSEGFLAITEAVHHMKECPRNVSAYLSAAIERHQSEYLDCDKLCSVPPRTQRDRIAKGKLPIEPPKIDVATDLALDDEESNTSVLSRLEESRRQGNSRKPEDDCGYEIDDEILQMRYEGADPRAIAAIGRDTVKEPEAPVYCEPDSPIPSVPRTKDTGFRKPRAHRAETPLGSSA